MITFSLILAVISFFTSFVPTVGIYISSLSLIVSLIIYKMYIKKITYKKNTTLISIILSIITIINSFIFTFYINVFENFLLINTESVVDDTKYVKLMQDYSSLQTAINFSKGNSTSIKSLTTSQNDEIYNSSLDIINYPENIKKIIATNDNKQYYYNINYNSIKLNLMLTKQECWVIDKNGRLYLNIDNYKKY